LLKKRNQTCLYVGYNRTYTRLKDAIAASSAYDTIYIDDEIREEPSPLIIKHPLEIIGKGSDGKIRLNAIEIQCPTVRISNVCLRPSSYRPQNPLPTVLKVGFVHICEVLKDDLLLWDELFIFKLFFLQASSFIKFDFI
jgi:hypothetical protein